MSIAVWMRRVLALAGGRVVVDPPEGLLSEEKPSEEEL